MPCACTHLPIYDDDDVHLGCWSSVYNIHVPGHYNNSITDERGYYIHADVSRPNGYDYTAHRNVRQHRTKCGILALISDTLMSLIDLSTPNHMNFTVLSLSLSLIYFMNLGYMSLNDICGVNLSIGITYKRVIPGSYAAC